MARTFETDVEGRWPYSRSERDKVLELDFPEEEYRDRLDRLYARMEREHLDTLVVYGGPNTDANVRYLTGWISPIGDSFVLVSTRHKPVVITNSIFHGEPMHSNAQACWVPDFRPFKPFGTVLNERNLVDCVAEALGEMGAREGRLGLVGGRRFPAIFDRDLRDRLPRAELVEASPLTVALRNIKSEREIELLRLLGKATTAGMEAALEVAVPGSTENDLAAVAQGAMSAHGCEAIPFGPKCQAGVRSAMKNVFPLPGKVIADGEIVSIDLQGQMKGYISDHARSTVAGRASAETMRLLEACAAAEEAGIRATGPGVKITAVMAAMSAVVKEWGFEDWDWSVGHGFGLELVETPYIVKENPLSLEAGQTFFIEPMIVPTHMGCSCFEDPILVTPNGAERLTTTRIRPWAN